MTTREFQKGYGPKLKEIIESPVGQATLSVLGGMRPPYEFPKEEHLLSENRGAMRGYELCIRNILALCIAPIEKEEVQANYGVSDKPNPE